MARYDLYRFNGGYVIDLQNDFIEIPGSRIVAPVVPMDAVPVPTRGLHPEINVDGALYLIATHMLAATPVSALSAPLGTYTKDGDRITRALDLLFQGY